MSSLKKGKEEVEIHWRIPEWFPNLNAEHLKKLTRLHEEFLRFNRTINLISTGSVATADQMHFADSVISSQEILKATQQKEIYDIGSGNGLPGLVIAIFAPDRKIICIEKDTRKVEYLKHVAAAIEIKNLEVRNVVAESLPVGSIRCGVSRGFASVSKAILLLRKVFSVEGEYFHVKGDTWSRELAEIPSQLCSFWMPSLTAQYQLPGRAEKRAVVLTKKIQN